jgi:hypothetical protein
VVTEWADLWAAGNRDPAEFEDLNSYRLVGVRC